jgi:hypothetical protein
MIKPINKLVAGALCIALLLSAATSFAAHHEEKVSQILFKNVHVWDGKSDGVSTAMNVLVEGKLIKKVGASESDAGSEATVVEGKGENTDTGPN